MYADTPSAHHAFLTNICDTRECYEAMYIPPKQQDLIRKTKALCMR